MTSQPVLSVHAASTSDVMIDALQKFFSRARNVVGSEETYRALLVYQLRQTGFDMDDIVAEYPTEFGRIDLAIIDRQAGCKKISHLIEIKGGAYGNRHALHDELKPGLESKDLKKLSETGDAGTKRWFLALDISSLKGPVDADTRAWVAGECVRRNIDFVYYDLSSSEAEVVGPETRTNISVEDQTPNFRMDPELGNILDSDLFWERSRIVPEAYVMHEQNQVLRIYENLMLHSVPDYAVSLETQFQFAKGSTSNGKNRPDICLFDPPISGNFNLYAQGKAARSRDALKLSKLQRLIEVKVSPSASDALADIQKLANWRSQMEFRAGELGVELPERVRFMFIAANIDHRIISEVVDLATELDISVRTI